MITHCQGLEERMEQRDVGEAPLREARNHISRMERTHFQRPADYNMALFVAII